MNPVVVCVATGHYVLGLRRLKSLLPPGVDFLGWANEMPPESPPHKAVPYAFKAFAIAEAIRQGYSTVLWADACIVPDEDLAPLWERIERDGYWMSRNGWANHEWTCDAVYPLLGVTREENKQIPHVVATTFGLCLKHEAARAFAAEYLRYAKNGAFCGPWMNKNHPDYAHHAVNERCAPCGPPTTRGHRHDQTAASLLAYRLGWKLTDPPEIFAYKNGETEQTLLVADGAY